MARFDEEPSSSTLSWGDVAAIVVFFGGLFLAEWIGPETGSLMASFLAGFAVSAAVFLIHRIFGIDYFNNDVEQQSLFPRIIHFYLAPILLFCLIVFLIFKVREEAAGGLGYYESSHLGFFSGCFLLSLVLIARSLIAAGRQKPQ